jgi:tetratricopeptide (TPR) repeat protein
VIPRWRPFDFAARTRELDSDAPASPSSSVEPAAEGPESFLDYPGMHSAADLVAKAFVQGELSPQSLDAARLLLTRVEPEHPAHALAERLIGIDDAALTIPLPLDFGREAESRRVFDLRSGLQRHPNNAIRWADLALAHTNLGALDKARREIRTAVALAPGNRYVLRSAVRFWLLVGDMDAAQAVLLRSPALLEDPWLLAAELAVAQSAGKRLRNVRHARRVLESSRHSPWSVSELVSALATAELRSGNLKLARKLMRRALDDPTENAIAQAEWATTFGVEAPQEQQLAQPFSFEARALAYAQADALEDAVLQGVLWQRDQPFALEPALFTSFMASVGTADYSIAVRSAQQGLVASPDSVVLRNNLIFALASSDEVDAAERELSRIPGNLNDPQAIAMLQATRGLLAFRSGIPEVGRREYAAAIQSMHSLGLPDRSALAAMFWAREEFRVGGHGAPERFRIALDLTQQLASDNARSWANRVGNLIRSLPTYG